MVIGSEFRRTPARVQYDTRCDFAGGECHRDPWQLDRLFFALSPILLALAAFPPRPVLPVQSQRLTAHGQCSTAPSTPRRTRSTPPALDTSRRLPAPRPSPDATAGHPHSLARRCRPSSPSPSPPPRFPPVRAAALIARPPVPDRLRAPPRRPPAITVRDLVALGRGCRKSSAGNTSLRCSTILRVSLFIYGTIDRWRSQAMTAVLPLRPLLHLNHTPARRRATARDLARARCRLRRCCRLSPHLLSSPRPPSSLRLPSSPRLPPPARFTACRPLRARISPCPSLATPLPRAARPYHPQLPQR